MRLLLTRPQADAERTAAALRAHGHLPILAPLFRIETVDQVDMSRGPWAALLLTSANGLRGLGAPEPSAWVMPVFAVGTHTERAAREAGFTTVHCAHGDAGDLAAIVTTHLKPPARLLYLAGEDRATDLDGTLRAQGFAVDLVVAYRAAAVDTLPPAAAAAMEESLDGVLHFSRRAVEVYLDATHRAGLATAALKPAHYCLSERVAAPLRQAGAATVRIAAAPSEVELLALIAVP